MATSEEMLASVKEHARKNYSTGGWDYVVECYEDEDLLEIIEDRMPWRADHTPKPCTTIEEAIKAVGEIVGVCEERRFEAQALSGELDHYGIEEGPDGTLRRKAEG